MVSAATALIANVLGFITTLRLLDEVGYADTYTLYDVGVAGANADEVRGVTLLGPSFRTAIRGAYAPFCVLEDQLYHLPDDGRTRKPLRSGLLALGCQPMRGLRDAVLVSW